MMSGMPWAVRRIVTPPGAAPALSASTPPSSAVTQRASANRRRRDMAVERYPRCLRGAPVPGSLRLGQAHLAARKARPAAGADQAAHRRHGPGLAADEVASPRTLGGEGPLDRLGHPLGWDAAPVGLAGDREHRVHRPAVQALPL